jgi:16S rRNA (adenine1518-N6/adenine1519-N6)-dimethyltransferase
MSIIDILRKYDIHPVKRFGQNFLIDPNIKRKILESLPLDKGKTFVEIGPGTGALTKQLLKKGERVVAIEIDKKLQAFLEESFSQHYANQFELFKGDVLEIMTEDFLRKVVGADEDNAGDVIVIGNLPYYLSSPILFRTLELNHLIGGAYFTLQKEVVDRLRAKAGTRNYGRLSASFGYFAESKKLFDISPGCFSPKPDIVSTFVEINFKKRFRDCKDREAYLELVKIAFSQRRKQLQGVLAQHYPRKAKQIEDCIIRLKLAPKVRAEELTASNFWNLLELLEKK